MKSLNYFKALADITRIRIYNVLLYHELSVNELVQLLKMGQSGISRHLKILTESGLLNCRRHGIWAFYSADISNGSEKFIQAVQYLFKEESSLNQDLLRAQLIIKERNLETKQFFNTIAHKWDLLKLKILGSFDLNATIVENIVPGSEAADLGCGTGELLSVLKKHKIKAIGVDSSSSMLDESRKRFSGENDIVDLRLGELEHLPLRDQEVQVAVISLALHHLSDPGIALAEAKRILKPEGTLIIAEFEKHDNEILQKTYGDRWLGFNQEEVETWLIKNSFLLKKIEKHKVMQSLTIIIYKAIKKIKE